ncbi:hypothetical protein CRG98_042694, partial [Punica granatum]
MAPAPQKATPSSACCLQGNPASVVVVPREAAPSSASASGEWTVAATDRREDKKAAAAVASLIRPVDSVPDPSANPSTKGVPVMLRAQTSHPLDPLSVAEISVAVATVRAAGSTPE